MTKEYLESNDLEYAINTIKIVIADLTRTPKGMAEAFDTVQSSVRQLNKTVTLLETGLNTLMKQLKEIKK
jgi:uncharacterized protein YukE